MDELYNFIYRGVLTEVSLDKSGRTRKKFFGKEEAGALRESLSFEMLDDNHLSNAQSMSIVYTAIHAFENSVRELVQKIMAEEYSEGWWEKVPEKIRKKVKTRKEEDIKFKWHGSRGSTDIMYCDFGDLSSIIVTNWDKFEIILRDMEWAKSILGTLEKSRNIIMHGGMIEKEDIERIGMNIRDWIRQTG